MDAIMDIAARHNVKVIEDVSHAQGTVYQGKKAGSIGDIAGISLMTNKSLAIGEGGMVVTNDRGLFERAVAFGHYERTGKSRYTAGGGVITAPDLVEYAGVPLGGVKYRMHQLSSAVGRVQLRHYDRRMAEIQKALNYFWDRLEGVPGLRAHRPPKDSGSTMGGWYFARGLYRPEELEGLPVQEFCRALAAEGYPAGTGTYFGPLHLHPVFQTADIYGDGRPTMLANTTRDIRQPEGSLPVSEKVPGRSLGIPWFKHFNPEIIDEYVLAYRKVSENYKELL
jgi:dTDP-4-amino-4,6-dideoxygalactose transaminase